MMDIQYLVAHVDPVALAIPVFVLLILIEMVAVWRGAKGAYEWHDSAASVTMGVGSGVVGALLGATGVAIAAFGAQHRLFDIPITWWSFAACFFLDDFLYYVFHRSAHRVRWFWASHVIHHSSQHYNLSTALRQTWTGFISLRFLFTLPLFIIGFPVELVIFCGGLNLVYQFWIHTEAVRRLPWGLESVLNTPSHHRVHHGTNPRYLDRNYAGVFIVFDRWFGTFEAEHDDEPVRYGIIKQLATFNPLWTAIHEWVGIARDVYRAQSWRARWMYMFGPPGWSPDGSRDTADVIRAAWEAERIAAE